jgi:hypothetical protein
MFNWCTCYSFVGDFLLSDNIDQYSGGDDGITLVFNCFVILMFYKEKCLLIYNWHFIAKY